MKKGPYIEEQIAFALKPAETSTRLGDICRIWGFLKPLLQLEEDIRRLGLNGTAASAATGG